MKLDRFFKEFEQHLKMFKHWYPKKAVIYSIETRECPFDDCIRNHRWISWKKGEELWEIRHEREAYCYIENCYHGTMAHQEAFIKKCISIVKRVYQ